MLAAIESTPRDLFTPDLFLERAWEDVRRNGGAAGIDRVTITDVEKYGVSRLLDEVTAALREQKSVSLEVCDIRLVLGVSIATLDDMKVLYSGFDLCSPSTSVSMTINGPAAMLFCFYVAAAERQGVDIGKLQELDYDRATSYSRSTTVPATS